MIWAQTHLFIRVVRCRGLNWRHSESRWKAFLAAITARSMSAYQHYNVWYHIIFPLSHISLEDCTYLISLGDFDYLLVRSWVESGKGLSRHRINELIVDEEL